MRKSRVVGNTTVAIRAVGLAAAVALIAGCQKGQRDSSADEADSLARGVDYQAIQDKAEAFVPDTGMRGGFLTLPTLTEPASFNPIISDDAGTATFTGYIYQGLTRLSGVTRMPVAALAERWEISPDGRTYTFYLREGVVWSDSTAFTAADVLFTFKKLIYNAAITSNPARERFLIDGKPVRVEALDSLTVRFVLPRPFAPFLRLLTHEILPEHLLEPELRAGRFASALGPATDPATIVGTGPFMLSSYIPAYTITFRRNPRYWERDGAGTRLPYLDSIVYRIFPSEDAQRAAFRKGDIDYLVAHGDAYRKLMKRADKGGYDVYRLGPAAGSNFLCFNQNTGTDAAGTPFVEPFKLAWFRATTFRRAVSHAIDRHAMIAAIMDGFGYRQWAPMTPSEGRFYNPDVTTYPHAPDSARSLLASIGLTDRDGDGTLEDSAGNPCAFTLLTNRGNVTRRKIAEAIRDDLEAIGITVTVEQVEFAELLRRVESSPYRWEAAVMGLSRTDDPHFAREVWVSSGSRHLWFPEQDTPSTPWEATIDSLFAAGVRELDRSARIAVYHRWQQLAARQQPLIYTIVPERILCLAKRFGNINPSVNGGLLHTIAWIYEEDA